MFYKDRHPNTYQVPDIQFEHSEGRYEASKEMHVKHTKLIKIIKSTIDRKNKL